MVLLALGHRAELGIVPAAHLIRILSPDPSVTLLDPSVPRPFDPCPPTLATLGPCDPVPRPHVPRRHDPCPPTRPALRPGCPLSSDPSPPGPLSRVFSW
jgi:hypothetical protein